MLRAPAKHRVFGRSVVELDKRDPSLVNLPLPVNSVPVVGPLASPLVGDSAGSDVQASPPPNPQPAPASPGGSGSGGSNGGSGSGNGGDGNGKGNGNGKGGSNGGGGGSNGGGSSGGGSPVIPIAPPASNGGNVAPPVPIVPNPTSPDPAPGVPSDSSSAEKASSGGSPTSPPSPGGSGNFLGVAVGETAPVNVGSGPSVTSAALDASAPTAFSSQYSLGSDPNTIGTAISLPTISTVVTVSSGKHLSGSAIAGITIVCLLSLLALILFLVRRRSIARRVELRRRWWFSHSPSGYSFSFMKNGSPRSPAGMSGEVPASWQSARSSFATNFDQGLMFHADSPPRSSQGLVPDLPPTAEVRERTSVLISTGGSLARRESMNSMMSNGSNPDTQYLIVSTSQNQLEPSTPMSVRLFSPSESFAFPKPPAAPSSNADTFSVAATPGPASSQSSSATLVQLSTPPRVFMTDIPPAAVSSLYPQTSMPNVVLSPPITVPNPSVDPFADPAIPEFSYVEVVRRPFTPSLDDELAVHPGDRVRILRIFDDGWAFVEKLARTMGERPGRGLIPIDCFCEVDQTLPTFLAEKRVSYGSDSLIPMAL